MHHGGTEITEITEVTEKKILVRERAQDTFLFSVISVPPWCILSFADTALAMAPRYFTSTGTPGSCLLERITSAVFTLATFFAAVSVSVMKDWKAERFSATHLRR